MKYKEPEIVALTNSLGGDEVDYNWLTKNNFNELAALSDVLKYGNNSAVQWLIKNKHTTILKFIYALRGEEKALKSLLSNREGVWAATASAVNGDKEAYEWLSKNNLNYFMSLVNVLTSKSSETGYFSSVMGGGDFSFDSSTFDGFGGGDFGGAGSGGEW